MDMQTLAAALAIGEKRRSALVANEYDSTSAYALGELVMRGGTLYECTTQITTPEEWNSAHWTRRTIEYYLSQIGVEYPRLGVSGVGGSSPTLTRLWDAVDLSSTPGTDAVTCSSSFDAFAPFNRRKCVGSWTMGDGKAVFTVQAYYGDADYAEDGTMGDYVAVEVTPFYYFESGDILGVSEHQFPGWKIHPVCVDLDGNIRARTYLPCYALSLNADGYAVSLPGNHNEYGSYKAAWDRARTYNNGALRDYAIIEPSAVDHYEWLLMTIEYATQDIQTVMNGAVNMRYVADVITLAPEANKIVLTSAIAASYVVGQSVYIGDTYSATPSNVSAYNCIAAIEACDEDGTPNEAGTHRLITYDGADRTAGITAGTTTISTRPWVTGATQGYAHGAGAVRGHTGALVSNASGRCPILYRWRENAYGNQYMTALDLMNVRDDEGDGVYHLDWYHLPDPRNYAPSTNSKPDIADLTNANYGWVRLSATTPSSSYANGYIKELGADDNYPHVPVPVLTIGGSSSTYYCDYAYLVSSPAVRSVRRRGSVSNGAYAGLRYLYADLAPSNASWYYGAGLFFIQ